MSMTSVAPQVLTHSQVSPWGALLGQTGSNAASVSSDVSKENLAPNNILSKGGLHGKVQMPTTGKVGQMKWGVCGGTSGTSRTRIFERAANERSVPKLHSSSGGIKKVTSGGSVKGAGNTTSKPATGSKDATETGRGGQNLIPPKGCRMCDLCDEDKEQLQNLLRRIVALTADNDHLFEEVEKEKRLREEIQVKNRELADEVGGLRSKLGHALHLLRGYQTRMREMQQAIISRSGPGKVCEDADPLSQGTEALFKGVRVSSGTVAQTEVLETEKLTTGETVPSMDSSVQGENKLPSTNPDTAAASDANTEDGATAIEMPPIDIIDEAVDELDEASAKAFSEGNTPERLSAHSTQSNAVVPLPSASQKEIRSFDADGTKVDEAGLKGFVPANLDCILGSNDAAIQCDAVPAVFSGDSLDDMHEGEEQRFDSPEKAEQHTDSAAEGTPAPNEAVPVPHEVQTCVNQEDTDDGRIDSIVYAGTLVDSLSSKQQESQKSPLSEVPQQLHKDGSFREQYAAIPQTCVTGSAVPPQADSVCASVDPNPPETKAQAETAAGMRMPHQDEKHPQSRRKKVGGLRHKRKLLYPRQDISSDTEEDDFPPFVNQQHPRAPGWSDRDSSRSRHPVVHCDWHLGRASQSKVLPERPQAVPGLSGQPLHGHLRPVAETRQRSRISGDGNSLAHVVDIVHVLNDARSSMESRYNIAEEDRQRLRNHVEHSVTHRFNARTTDWHMAHQSHSHSALDGLRSQEDLPSSDGEDEVDSIISILHN